MGESLIYKCCAQFKMKKTFLIFILTFLIFGQSYSQNTCDCWEKLFASNGLNYDTEFEEMEKSFIDQNYLQNSRPESYWALADSIIQRSEYYLMNVEFNPLFIKGIEKCIYRNDCDNKVYRKFRRMNNKLSSYKNISPRKVFKDFKKLFNRKDFYQNIVKHYFLLFYIAPLLQQDNGIQRIKVGEN